MKKTSGRSSPTSTTAWQYAEGEAKREIMTSPRAVQALRRKGWKTTEPDRGSSAYEGAFIPFCIYID